MRVEQVGDHVITAWAERIGDHWHGMASIAPPIPNLWHGGRTGDSLVSDGMHASEELAINEVLVEALKSVIEALRAASGQP